MIDFNDELLNRYLDGELDVKEQAELEKYLKENETARKRFNSLNLVHSNLFRIKENSPSVNFTESVMMSITRKSKSRSGQKFFIISVSSFFVLLCFLIFGFLLANILGSTSTSGMDSQSLNTINNFTNSFISEIKKLFSGQGLSIFGSILSLGIIISGYIFFEKQKHTNAHLS
jgi:anti-sigma factor RsiW